MTDEAYEQGKACFSETTLERVRREERKRVLDSAKACLDRYYKSLPAKHPYLDGIDMSIQQLEKLQESLHQQDATTELREKGEQR
jgi:hypothetical protein